MSGKRLLDAAKIFGAARKVARNHAAIRAQQWDVYTSTSSLAKAVKSQTDRVTVTAGAAFALAKRFNEAGPTYTATSRAKDDHTGSDAQTIPRQDTVWRSEHLMGQEEGIQQDHHYGRSEQNATVDPPPEDDLDITQEQAIRYPLADGSIPPEGTLRSSPSRQGKDTFAERPTPESTPEHLAGDSPESELGVTQKKAARYPLKDGTVPPKDADLGTSPSRQGADSFGKRPGNAPQQEPLVNEDDARPVLEPKESDESVIPTPEQDPQNSSDTVRKMQRQYESQIPEVSSGQQSQHTSSQEANTDTFSTRPDNASPQLSSLPRTKIPRYEEDAQGGDKHIQEGQLNQDVYYSSQGTSQEQTEDVRTDIFHSPRIASMLRGSNKDDRRKAYEMKMNLARKSASAPQRETQATNNITTRPSEDTGIRATSPSVVDKHNEDETRGFAESLAQDAEQTRISATEVNVKRGLKSKHGMLIY